jgi:pSer/pThr/pTyr-binding forkhead associated (FHA) protein
MWSKVGDDPAYTLTKASDSGFRTRTRIVYVLRNGANEYRLNRNQIVIGRSSSSDIQITSNLVSRQHARLTQTNLGVLVDDLGSRNGVYVNSQKVRGSCRLKSGDTLTIGDENFHLAEIEEPVEERGSITLVGGQAYRDSFGEDDQSVATRSADVFQLLAGVVDKALALGRGEEAEHIIGAHLAAALNDALHGARIQPDLARAAAGYALKIAGSTGKPSWIDYTLRLYHCLKLPLPLALVDDMYALLRRVKGIDLTLLRDYSEALRLRVDTLTPAERFVVQRIVGLERLATWQSNNVY